MASSSMLSRCVGAYACVCVCVCVQMDDSRGTGRSVGMGSDSQGSRAAAQGEPPGETQICCCGDVMAEVSWVGLLPDAA